MNSRAMKRTAAARERKARQERHDACVWVEAFVIEITADEFKTIKEFQTTFKKDGKFYAVNNAFPAGTRPLNREENPNILRITKKGKKTKWENGEWS